MSKYERARHRESTPPDVTARLQHLGNEEGIAGGQLMEFGWVDLPALRQSCHTRHRERWQPQPTGRSLAGQCSQREPEWIVGHEGVVAISSKQQHRQVLDPSAEVAQQVQSCFIGPVDVFNNDNDERWHVAELSQ